MDAMAQDKCIFAQTPDARPLYRRDFRKADGRMVRLYGYAPHDLPPLHDGLEGGHGEAGLRYHPLRAEWNIYAAARQGRTFKPASSDDPLAASQPGGAVTEIPFSDFELCIFDNRFPSLRQSSPQSARSEESKETRIATGHCDVVVYGPEQSGSLATLSQDRRILLIEAWNDRYKALFSEGVEYVLPFENRGDEVGVTLSHPHGQIYAFDFVPPVQAAAVNAFAEGFDLATSMSDWLADYEVISVGGLAAFVPPFARFPYECWIAPLERRDGPWALLAEELEAFAFLLGDITRRYDALFEREAATMLSLHAAPRNCPAMFHFTAQFYPVLRAPDKIKYLAGVEQAAGVFTVDILPENAAAALRSL